MLIDPLLSLLYISFYFLTFHQALWFGACLGFVKDLLIVTYPMGISSSIFVLLTCLFYRVRRGYFTFHPLYLPLQMIPVSLTHSLIYIFLFGLDGEVIQNLLYASLLDTATILLLTIPERLYRRLTKRNYATSS